MLRTCDKRQLIQIAYIAYMQRAERDAKSCHTQELCFITRAPEGEVFSGEVSLGPNKLCKLFRVLFVRAEHYVIFASPIT